jgi:hypothetical protein
MKQIEERNARDRAKIVAWMRELYPSLTAEDKKRAEDYFPELKESEDEKCCRQLIAHIQRADALSEDKKSYFLNWIEQHKEACTPKNGVYPEADGVRIWHDGHTFKVPFDWDKGKHTLLTQEGYERSKEDKERLQNEADALLDWDFVAATEKIQELGTDIPLGENEYLPTAPVYLAMYKYRKMLNEALREAGAKEIDFSKDAWFAQRGNVDGAWSFHGHGYLNGYIVNLAFACRAVTL